jgi:glucosamine--fructose-6-phosphate aminotransferase (isomerizing)
VGKVADLQALCDTDPVAGTTGIAHTRWATHGQPNSVNSHPHVSAGVSVVHNGIIENHDALRDELRQAGYVFVSDTDTEVVAHLVRSYLDTENDLQAAVSKAISRLEGAYALGVMSDKYPGLLVGARSGSPLVLGVGIDENFIASDQMALRQVTDRFVYLEEGHMVVLTTDGYAIFNQKGKQVDAEVHQLQDNDERADKGDYRHFMQKEMFEQPAVVANTMAGRLSAEHIQEAIFGYQAETLFAQVSNLHIIACGTSFHSGLVAKYWLEDIANIPCQVEVASEYRYRKTAVPEGTLFVTVSQSGETADTLAALRKAKELGYLGFLAICNVANSSLVRESDI